MPEPSPPTRILGIDPGSRVTGFGVVDASGPQYRHVAHGCIRTEAGSLTERLLEIHRRVIELIHTWNPCEAAVETVFVKQRAASALVLGHARGTILLALGQHAMPLAEYAPAQVKSAIAGHGRAEKAQIQTMVRLLLNLRESPAADAADALALAICHAHWRRVQRVAGGVLAGPRAR